MENRKSRHFRRFSLLALFVWAVVQGAVARASEVWTTDFGVAKASAAQTGRPLAVITGKGDCPHCADLKAALRSTDFAAWVHLGDVDICYIELPSSSKDATGDQLDAYAFCFTDWSGSCPKPSEFPVVALYQVRDGVERKLNFSGQDGWTYAGRAGDPLWRQMVDSLEKYFFAMPDVRGAFVADEYPAARLEWDDGTTTLAVPVRRAADAVGVAATNVLTAAAGGVETTAVVAWTVEATNAYALVDVRPFAGQTKIDLYLSNDYASRFAASSITYAPGQENNPKNPLFLGEKTAGELGWGEWTMDIDVATQKVAAVSGAATLILVGGSLWCPDCYSTDHYLIETDEFKAWARRRQIACVAIDVINPNSATANTSLLTWDTARVGDRYVTCNYSLPTNETLRYESGAGYLSRHGVRPEAAAAVAMRNKWLLNSSTEVGGLCRPEDLSSDNEHTGPFKTGIPCLIAMRADGSIAGRIYQFNNVSASGSEHLAAYVARLDELFDQVGQPEEESNDDALTTAGAVVAGGVAQGTLSAVDGRDTYRIAAAKDMRMVFTLTGASAAELTLTSFDTATGARVVLDRANGRLSDGVVLTTRTTSASCCLEIGFPKDASGYATGVELAFTNVASTLCAYSLTTEGSMSGGDIAFTRTALEVSEDCEGAVSKRVSFSVERTGGSRGAVVARVVLRRTPAAEIALRDGYIVWEDAEINWAGGHAEPQPVEFEIVDNDWEDDDLPLVFSLELVSAEAPDTAVSTLAGQLSVTVVDDDSTSLLAYRNVAFSDVRVLEGWQAGDEVVLAKVAGSAPSGVMVSAINGELVVSGKPTRSGSYAVDYQVLVLRNGVLVSSSVETFKFAVCEVDFSVSVPSLAKAATYANLPVLAGREVTGLLTLTVPPSGKLSAKYRTKGKTCSYSASAWSSYDRWNGVLTAELMRTGSSGERLTVTLQGETAAFELEDPLGEGVLAGDFALSAWGADDPADAWEGQYVIQLKQTDVVDSAPFARLTGDGYLALRMVSATAVRNGQMLYAGVLPNGRAVSGRSVLMSGGGSSALLPFFAYANSSSSPFVLSGVFEIMAEPWDVAALGTRWSVYSANDVRTVWSVPDGYGRTAGFEVYGAYYDPSELYACYQADFGKRLGEFAFRCASDEIGSGRFGAGAAFSPVAAEVTEESKLVVANDDSVRLTFSPYTGVASGTVRLPFAAGSSRLVTFRGIVLPGWGACEDCHWGTVATRPFLSGSVWFADGDAVGSWRNGCRVEVNVPEEK